MIAQSIASSNGFDKNLRLCLKIKPFLILMYRCDKLYPICNIYCSEVSMKISLSLCLSLSLISSVLNGGDSNPFNQKRSGAQEEIKTGLPKNNEQGNGILDKYVFPGLNIASTGAAVFLAIKTRKEDSFVFMMPMLLMQTALNLASARADQSKSSTAKVVVGGSNIVWAGLTYFVAKPLLYVVVGTMGTSFFPIYFTSQAAASALNGLHTLWNANKKQS